MGKDASTLRAELIATGISARDIARGARIHAMTVERFMALQIIIHPNTIDRLKAWLDKGAHVPRLHCQYKGGKPCGEAFVKRMLAKYGGGDYFENPNTAYHTPETPDMWYENGRTVQA